MSQEQGSRGRGKTHKRSVKYRRHITTSLPTISEEPRLSFEVAPPFHSGQELYAIPDLVPPSGRMSVRSSLQEAGSFNERYLAVHQQRSHSKSLIAMRTMPLVF